MHGIGARPHTTCASAVAKKAGHGTSGFPTWRQLGETELSFDCVVGLTLNLVLWHSHKNGGLSTCQQRCSSVFIYTFRWEGMQLFVVSVSHTNSETTLRSLWSSFEVTIARSFLLNMVNTDSCNQRTLVPPRLVYALLNVTNVTTAL